MSAVPDHIDDPRDAANDPSAGHGLRIPPHSIEAEQSVLGALLVDNSAFDRASDLLNGSEFYRASHRLIWAAIADLILVCKPADVVTVFERLQATGKAADVDGLAYINSLAASVASAANVRRYAEIVAEKATRRALILKADEVATMAWDGGKSIDETLDHLGGSLVSLQSTQMRNVPRRLADLVPLAIDRYTALAEGTTTVAMPTGLPMLDKLLNGGMRPGKVYGLAARPSVGKSSAARAICINVASRGYPSLLLSQEMPVDEVADCAIAQLGEIESGNLATGRFAAGDWDRVTQAAEMARQLPIYIDDDGGLTIAQIRGKARMVKGLRLLVLDYLQLSTSTLKNATTNDQVAEISKGLKQLALQMGLSILVLSQLNRQVEQRADREPQLSDLRDSGAIEQDLDAAILLWTVREPSDGPRLVGWKLAKHRGGSKGRWGMWFDAPVYAWQDAPGQLPAPGSTGSARGGASGGFE